MRDGELSDTAAQRMAGDVNGVDAEHRQPPGHDVCVPPKFVRRVGAPGKPVTGQVGYEDAAACREDGRYFPPGQMAVAETVNEKHRRLFV